ncbi:hypothetical protein PVAND_008441 [Polypedilum vanderplanki]|uniref:Ionotropic receptor n=1 Tax=Polypedilum vanderplanki TaxID=319348 RepID=A0A9J6CA10_POLVA|nr:hypothetical protein PVAND_008441 [Polypedilum vanderplanki]
MKLLRIFSLLLILISISHQIDSNQNLIIKNDSKLSKFICRLIFDLKRKNPNAKFVAIGTTMQNDFEKNLIDKISYCLSKNEMAKMNFDFNEKFVDKIKAKSADFVILIADEIKLANLFNFILNNYETPPALNFMSKFLIVNSNSKNANSLATTMTDCNIFNFGILYEDVNDETTVFTANFFFNTTEIHKRIKREEIIDRIYPDKLKNLNGYSYKTFMSLLLAHVDKSTGEVFSKYFYFLQEISKIQNAKINLTVWPSTDTTIVLREVEKSLEKQNFDLLLFRFSQNNSYDSRLDIYEQNGICFIIPTVTKHSENFNLFPGVFSKNFQLLLIFSKFFIIFIWRLFKKRGVNNSASKIALFLWASACDQSLKLRQNRLVLTVMLQFFVIGIFYRNLIFNAEFTSIMTVPTTDFRYKTISEVIESKEKFITEGFVAHYLKYNEIYQKIQKEGRVKIRSFNSYFSKDFGDRIIIFQCKIVPTYERMNNWSPDSYYLLPEKIYPHYNQLEVGILNPFKEKFQKYIDLSFESGLMQIWETFYILKTLGIKRKYFEKNDENILTWKEIKLAFLQLGAGLTLATFGFICEILHFHIFRHWFGKICGILKRKILVKKERKVMKVKRINLGKKKTRNPRRLNVKKTKVHPANNQLFYLE